MTISSPGIGSGLDVNSIVQQLIASERQGPQSQIDTQRSHLQTQVSALGSIKSALAAIQTSLTGLTSGSTFKLFSTSVGNLGSGTAGFSATASSTASSGTYGIRVDNLATAQKVTSTHYLSSSSTIGTGTLTIAAGGHTLNLTINSTNNTLSGIANAINTATGNPGVIASILTAGDGAHLTFTSTSTGIANAATVTTSGGDGGLTALTYNPGTGLGGMTTINAATDAHLRIDGSDITSASNTVTSAITGVSINLTAGTAGATQTLTVSPNNDAVKSAVNIFVASYNAFVAASKQVSSYDPTTRQAGPLLGDSTLLTVSNQLTQALGSAVGASTASYRSLSDLGVQIQVDGTLSLNTTKLDAALASNPTQAAAVFSGTTGVGKTLNTLLNGLLNSGGIFDSRTQSLAHQSDTLDQAQIDLDRRLANEQSMYQAQFTALDTLLSSLKSTSNFLTQQMAAFSPSSR